jgi:hypothetical protein
MAGDRSYPSYAAFMEELQQTTPRTAAETVARFAEGRHEHLKLLAAQIASTDPDLIVAIRAVSHFAVQAAVGSMLGIQVPLVNTHCRHIAEAAHGRRSANDLRKRLSAPGASYG